MAQPVFDLSRHTRHQLFEAILQTLNGMPEHLRKIFVLSHYQGCGEKEIAESLGLAEKEIPRLLRKAKLKFFNGVRSFRMDSALPARTPHLRPADSR